MTGSTDHDHVDPASHAGNNMTGTLPEAMFDSLVDLQELFIINQEGESGLDQIRAPKVLVKFRCCHHDSLRWFANENDISICSFTCIARQQDNSRLQSMHLVRHPSINMSVDLEHSGSNGHCTNRACRRSAGNLQMPSAESGPSRSLWQDIDSASYLTSVTRPHARILHAMRRFGQIMSVFPMSTKMSQNLLVRDGFVGSGNTFGNRQTVLPFSNFVRLFLSLLRAGRCVAVLALDSMPCLTGTELARTAVRGRFDLPFGHLACISSSRPCMSHQQCSGITAQSRPEHWIMVHDHHAVPLNF